MSSSSGGAPLFLHDRDASARSWKGPKEHGITPTLQWLGQGKDPIAVCWAIADTRPSNTALLAVWKKRHGNAVPPVLLIVTHPEGAVLCGTSGEDPPIVALDRSRAERIAAAALDEPNRHAAARSLFSVFDTDDDEASGVVNKGLFATHELLVGVPQRADWKQANDDGQTLLKRRNRDLITALGYSIEAAGAHEVLRDADDKTARAVAVFLHPGESPHVASAQRGNATPVSWAMTHADRNNIPWIITVQGSTIRLYSTATAGAAGQRSRETTYTELNLTLLPDDRAGYLPLLFSADALAPTGTVAEIREASADYAADLAARLRERVYDHVVPTLATAIARRAGADPDLDAAYRTALTVLFRLLFLGYAEAQRLLPYRRNAEYTDASLSTRARHLADAHNRGDNLGFDDPLTPEVEDGTDTQTDLWDTCLALFRAVDKGHTRWGVPLYNGGLFSPDPDINPAGAAIEGLRLTNAEFGPALMALLIDDTADGGAGPIDFRSLSVREFGTIYEGLLESELAIADQDLTLVKRKDDDVYEPARAGDDIWVAEGSVYLHNASGARKASGSYFTRPFAVEHLLGTALVPTLDKHLERVAALLAKGQEADAAEALFDFRIVDISMGSGHFLTAAVDRIEARISAWLADNPIPGIDIELQTLREAAKANLTEEQHDLIEDAALLRRLVARRCIYGVDLNPVSVELARVSMWIHTFVAGLPLSFLNHNLTVGNSLTGIATIDEAVQALTPTDASKGTTTLIEKPIRDLLAAAEDPMKRLGRILDTTTADLEQARALTEEARQAIEPVQDLLDSVVAARLGVAPMPLVVTEADLADVGSDEATQAARDVDALHFPTTFPEVFIRDRSGFDVIVGNPPYKEATVEELRFWLRHSPGLKAASASERRARINALRAKRPDLLKEYEREVEHYDALRGILHNGPFPGMGIGDPDLYKAFCWRFLHLVRDGGALGLVLPRSVLTTMGSSEWRKDLFTDTDVHVTTVRNTNEWVFTEVNPGYTFAFLAARNRNQHRDAAVHLYGRFASMVEYHTGMKAGGAVLSTDLLADRDNTFAIPDLGSPAAVGLLGHLLTVPKLGDSGRLDFTVAPTTDFHATNDRKKTGILKDDGDWPVYNHLNIGHFNFDVDPGEFTRCDFDEAITELHRRKQSTRAAWGAMQAGRGREWAVDPTTDPALNPRIVFRDVVHASNQRKVWAALVPAKTILTNTAPHLLFSRGELFEQAWVLAMMNSSVCDWYGHLFVGLHLNYFILNTLPIPVFDPANPLHRRATELAAAFALQTDGEFGPWYEVLPKDMPQLDDALAELDAIASIAYDISPEYMPLIWDGNPLRPNRDDVVARRSSLT